MSAPQLLLAGVVIEFAAVAIGLFGCAWVAIFGSTAALLAQARGGTVLAGFVYGAVFGPVGWALVWVQTRSVGSKRERSEAKEDAWSLL